MCWYHVQCEVQRCSSCTHTINAAADHMLYYILHGFPDYVNIDGADLSFLKGTMRLKAENGTLGSIHSLTRINDWDLTVRDQNAKNSREKSMKTKLYSNINAKFEKLEIEYPRSVIKFVTCRIVGKLRITAGYNLFEAVTVSSEKRNCLMDLKLLKIHKLEPLDVKVLTEENRICASVAQMSAKGFIWVFNSFVKSKIRELLYTFFAEHIPKGNAPMCLTNSFDVVFV